MDQLSPFELKIRNKLLTDFPYYTQLCLKIRSKSGDILPFNLNREQIYLHEQLQKQLNTIGRIRAIILKGRQQGISTYVQGRFFWRVTNSFGKRAFILTHHQSATDNIYEIARRFYTHCPEILRPRADILNAHELLFTQMDSGYNVGTARTKEIGRSATIQYFHGSEVAFWENAELHAKGIMNTIPTTDFTEILLESTANGNNNYFYRMWKLAEASANDYLPIFIPWFWHSNYTLNVPKDFIPTEEEKELIEMYKLNENQIMWRRYKILEMSAAGGNGEIAFKQEYPCHANEAFLTSNEDFLISTQYILKARQPKNLEIVSPLIIGVDPARFGDDATAIIRRRGRIAYNLQRYYKVDTMGITGKLVKIIEEEKPLFICIDCIGIGAGIVDRLRELGYGMLIISINAGANALRDDKYFNKRAEMWGLMSSWFQEEPVQIPDEDLLHSDLTNCKHSFDSNGRLKLELKDNMKKRIGRSPDAGDALALTFAKHISCLASQNINEKKMIDLLNSKTASFWGN